MINFLTTHCKSLEEMVHKMVEFFFQNPKVKRSLGDFYIPKISGFQKTSPDFFQLSKIMEDDPFLSEFLYIFRGLNLQVAQVT